jgi:hypothetical protein
MTLESKIAATTRRRRHPGDVSILTPSTKQARRLRTVSEFRDGAPDCGNAGEALLSY